MKKRAILADSGCQIGLGEAVKEGIFIVPLGITIDQKTYLDQKEITSLEVFDFMNKTGKHVLTSQPATGEMLKVIERIKDEGYDEIIGLPMATGLSSTLNGMKIAADMCQIPIHLIDTKTTAGNHAYLVKIAAKLIKEDKETDEIIKILNDLINHSGTIIMAPNLDHLKKGGRITPAVALLGGMLKIVPVMELNYDLGGKIDTLAKVRTISIARLSAVNRMKELGVTKDEYIFTIEHVLCEDSANELKNKLFEIIGEGELTLRELPSVVGAHMGVGGLGIQYIKKYKGE